MEELLVSKSGAPFPSWMKWFAFAVGIVLVGDGMRVFMFHKILVGVFVLYVSGYEKRIALTTDGLVRTAGSWFRKSQTTLPWSEITHVAFSYRGKRMMGFFEKEITGWKVLFSRDDEPAVREILKEYIPDVEVESLGA